MTKSYIQTHDEQLYQSAMKAPKGSQKILELLKRYIDSLADTNKQLPYRYQNGFTRY